MKYKEILDLVPIAQKCLLSIEETITYTGFGRHMLLELSEKDELNLVIWTGRKRLFKRKKLEEFIENTYLV